MIVLSILWKSQKLEKWSLSAHRLQSECYLKQETCRSIKLRELSACGRFVSHTKATEHKCRMTAHGPSSTSQLRRPRMLRCHCLPPGSLHVLGAFGSLSKSHISPGISHLKWHKIVCMRYLACAFSQMKSTDMFSMYLQSGVPRHFIWWFIAGWT